MPRSLRQVYRCPQGHVSEIVWSAEEVALAIGGNDLKFYCARCDDSRLATAAETNAILEALGLPPR